MPGDWDSGAEFDQYEPETLDAVCAVADRAEQLQRVYDAELAGVVRPDDACRVSAEIRHCERESVQMLERVWLTPEPVRSPLNQRAARARLDREPQRNAPRVAPRPVQAVQ